jgi:hypothetical protein
MKRLIAYFSWRGNNDVGGKIVDLPVGNTEVASAMIRELTGPAADLRGGYRRRLVRR